MGFFRRQRHDVEQRPATAGWGGAAGDPLDDAGRVDAPGTGGSGAELQWGLPTRCPRCGGFGYLDRIDLVHEVMQQHCPTCWHRWELSKAEVDAASAALD